MKIAISNFGFDGQPMGVAKMISALEHELASKNPLNLPDVNERTKNDPFYLMSSDAVLKMMREQAKVAGAPWGFDKTAIDDNSVGWIIEAGLAKGWASVELLGKQLLFTSELLKRTKHNVYFVCTFTGAGALGVGHQIQQAFKELTGHEIKPGWSIKHLDLIDGDKKYGFKDGAQGIQGVFVRRTEKSDLFDFDYERCNLTIRDAVKGQPYLFRATVICR